LQKLIDIQQLINKLRPASCGVLVNGEHHYALTVERVIREILASIITVEDGESMIRQTPEKILTWLEKLKIEAFNDSRFPERYYNLQIDCSDCEEYNKLSDEAKCKDCNWDLPGRKNHFRHKRSD